MSLSKLLGNGSKTIAYGGKEYELKPFTVEQIAQYEAWIERELWSAHRRSRVVLTSEEYQENAQALLEKIGTHQYSYPMPGYFKVFFSLPGMKRYVWMTLSQRYPGFTEEDADKMVEEQWAKVQAELVAHEQDFQSGTEVNSLGTPSL